MNLLKTKWFQTTATLTLGAVLGAWQLLPSSNGVVNKVIKSEIDKLVYRNTAEIEPLLKLTAPQKSASVDAWYRFALSLDDLEFGKRYTNKDDASPVLSWYTLIAKYKPQALYKLYNQGKLAEFKFNHLLRYGYLKYWDESVSNVDKVLLNNNQAVLTMSYNKGVEATRQRVKQAFFSVAFSRASQQSSTPIIHTLNVEVLLFAMKTMTATEKMKVLPALESGAFDIDPQYLYRLKLNDTFSDETLVALIERFSKKEGFTNRERPYSNNKILSRYMADAALFGSERYVQTLIENVEFNAQQPIDEYCAACGLALATEGLIAYPLINLSKKSKIELQKSTKNNDFILSRKGKRQ